MRRESGVFDVNYVQDMKIFRTKYHVIGMIALIAFFLSLPFFKNQFWLTFINSTAVTIIALQGLNILSGYCGQISIGHTAFMAVGAYSSTILAAQFGLPLWLCMIIGALCAGLIGILFGLPSLRVKGYYLALTTIAAQFIIIYLIKTPFPEITGGAIALQVPEFTLGGFKFETETHFYYLIITLLIMTTFFSKSVLRSKFGRAFIAIRDNDIAAEAMGINLYKYKLLAFFLGCFYAGFAGALWAAYARVISPDDFTLMNSIWQMGMLIIGGLGSTLGPFFGALFIKLLNEICLVAGPFISSIVPQIGAQISASLVEMSFGVAIILFLAFEPRGIAHRWEILKDSYRLWPFSY
ncbi:MAG TPA: branched-chain amino acid ABC transporter permease [Smithellaceae bacterium]|jgi:branched-chain amino acid transport system permease protein|nr:branched-chain amino acid ABC transporter permease [Smithellaceae bacterium]HNT90946.1 branched-chain amino acid ABC transporter permease [Smithellaceae bacterium]HNV64598.1 branched-chain amino acid ABC transporter permease [Smithellaceae bacterium]HOF76906.1 branched-chain amino acid ABC transporter permease [Smithellaceae bacterium]HOM69866.1 branched-chain amino acid ABC transporter permease [Smithellaceae bacterium]